MGEFGTQTEVISTANIVNDAGLSLSTDATTFTVSDDELSAVYVLTSQFTINPLSNSSVDLIGRLLSVEGANDSVEPTQAFLHTYITSFPLAEQTTQQTISAVGRLPNVETGQQYDFYIRNNSGQDMSAGATVHITTTAVNAKA